MYDLTYIDELNDFKYKTTEDLNLVKWWPNNSYFSLNEKIINKIGSCSLKIRGNETLKKQITDESWTSSILSPWKTYSPPPPPTFRQKSFLIS